MVLATVGSSSKSELEFWDLDFHTDDISGRREAAKEEWGAGIAHLGTADHYGVTDVEWDPSGRYLATSASSWQHTVCCILMSGLIFVQNGRSKQLKERDRLFLTPHYSLRTDTRYGISRVKNWKNTSRIVSNSSCGDRARRHCCRRKGSARSGKT